MFVLKQVVSIGLIFTIIFTNVNKVWIFIDFKLNQNYIAEELCENKDSQELSCKGKCQLVKQLRVEEEKEKRDIPSRLKAKSEVLFLNTSFFKNSMCVYLIEGNRQAYFYCNLYKANYFNQIFHPPQYA